jgi:hypothetical protein
MKDTLAEAVDEVFGADELAERLPPLALSRRQIPTGVRCRHYRGPKYATTSTIRQGGHGAVAAAPCFLWSKQGIMSPVVICEAGRRSRMGGP